MLPTHRPVVVFFAFANDRVDPAHYLRNLPDEQRRVRAAIATAVQAGLCEVVERANATLDEVLGVFQDPAYRDRIAVFHFGGHARSSALLLESRQGAASVAYAPGLARFLAEQRGLKLVFLNGCSSRGHVQGLLDAGVPGVIATSQAIDDEVATELSARFYTALASGNSIRTAYAEASAAVQTRYGARVWRDLGAPGTSRPAEGRWPWDLYSAPGAEASLDRWSLPQAAGDPLFGLPSLPALDFPPSPFRHLAPFSREEATVFFGRGREIRELFDALTLPEGAPIVLLFGAAGAGKSSLLAAGLQPRLETAYDVLYLRRDGAQGLVGTLARGLEGLVAAASETTPATNAATDQPIATLTGHTATVTDVSFSPDGTRVVTASVDKTARIWAAATGQPIAILTGHQSLVFDALFSTDGTRVVTASEDRADLERCHRPVHRHPHRAHAWGPSRVIQPGRDSGGDRVPGQDSADLERCQRPAHRHPRRAHAYGLGHIVQPGRDPAGDGVYRQHGADLASSRRVLSEPGSSPNSTLPPVRISLGHSGGKPP
jgi:hypothetical protein